MDLIPPLTSPELSISIAKVGVKAHVEVKGTLAPASPDKVADPWFQRAHDAISQAGVQTVEVDIRKLSFVSSSGIRVFIDWIGRIRNEPTDRQYTLVLRSNSQVEWQDRSVRALRVLGRGLVKVDAEIP